MPLRPLLDPLIKSEIRRSEVWFTQAAGRLGGPCCAADHQHSLGLGARRTYPHGAPRAFVKPPALDGSCAALAAKKSQVAPLAGNRHVESGSLAGIRNRLLFSARSIKPNALVSSALVGIREPAENHRLVYG